MIQRPATGTTTGQVGGPAEMVEFVTYLTDAVDPRPERWDGLRAGHPVLLLRRADGDRGTVEVWSPSLGRLGCLPREDGEVLAPLLQRDGSASDTTNAPPDGSAPLAGQVSALVPRPGRTGGGTRIHIRVSGRIPPRYTV